MTRRTYRWDPETRQLVEIGAVNVGIAHHGVIGDVPAYKSMITGEMIEGRRAHREHLRRHGAEEMGNEMPVPKTPEYVVNRRELRDEIRRSYTRVRDGMAPTLQQLRERGLAE